jgi:hypothetical protein
MTLPTVQLDLSSSMRMRMRVQVRMIPYTRVRVYRGMMFAVIMAFVG